MESFYMAREPGGLNHGLTARTLTTYFSLIYSPRACPSFEEYQLQEISLHSSKDSARALRTTGIRINPLLSFSDVSFSHCSA
jgi:hypothetical protein